MAVLRVFEITVGVIFSHRPTGFIMRASGVDGSAQWALRWSTHQRRVALGNNNGYPDALYPIFTPLMPFLWVLNISVT